MEQESTRSAWNIYKKLTYACFSFWVLTDFSEDTQITSSRVYTENNFSEVTELILSVICQAGMNMTKQVFHLYLTTTVCQINTGS